MLHELLPFHIEKAETE